MNTTSWGEWMRVIGKSRSLVGGYRCFGETRSLSFQNWRD